MRPSGWPIWSSATPEGPVPEPTPGPNRVDVDLTIPSVVHVVGVGGAGMSAIATVLAEMGHRVSGSDLRDTVALERLRAVGVEVMVGNRAEHVGPGVGQVAISSAVPDGNVEVREARRLGIPVLRRARILAAIASVRRTVAVAGTHGKTTTSSMLALVLMRAGLHPSFIIGGEVNEIGTGAAWDEGDWFVVEADESDGTFVELPRQAAILTNVEPDHLEHYGGVEGLLEAFDRFVAETEGPKVVCADDPVAASLAARHGATTYGTAVGADWRMCDLRADAGGTTFTVVHGAAAVGEVHLPVAGAHNARNACAAVVTGMLLGVPFEVARQAMAAYGGVARRFEHRGEAGGVAFIDDYAHLPTEVAAAIDAARSGGWGRVVVVFQPHRYSRTAALWRDFAEAFVGADVLVLTDVYPAGEAPRPGVSGKLVLDAVLDRHPRQRVVYAPRRHDVVRYLVGHLRPGDLCLTLGAGDLTSTPDEVQEGLAARRGLVASAAEAP
jgi:UDP-N-acetylmuramate--alanine ligase